MATIRIFFLSSVFTLFFPIFTFAQEAFLYTNISAKELCTKHCRDMNPEELQITANIIYLLYTNALIDSKIQEFHNPFFRLSQMVRINMTDSNNLNNELATLALLIANISDATKTRLIYTEMLNTCLDYYDQHKTERVDQALEALQLHAQESLRAWADENNQQFIPSLEASSAIMAKGAHYFHSASNFHKGLRNGDLPFEVENDSKSLAIIHTILKSSPNFINTADTIVDTLNETVDLAIKIICIGTEIYKHYYETIHAIITAESYDKNHATILFGVKGLLPQECRSTLPRTDQVFEHMHATTELYVSTEL